MVVAVLLFASLAERAGKRSLNVELDEGCDVAALWARLVGAYPGLAQSGCRPLVACDQAYADWSRPLAGVREVAFLPPVSGG